MAKIERLRSRTRFATVLKTGRRVHAGVLVAHVLDRGDEGPCRVGVVASRRIGGAVERHRASRRLREAARAALGGRQGLDVVLSATPAALACDFGQLREAIFQILDEKVPVT